MKHIKLFELFLNESRLDKAIEKIQALPQGKMFNDAKNIEGIFKKSKHTWSEVIETFEKNQDQAKEVQIPIKDIQITQPNIQMGKVEKMLIANDLPLINVVKFKDGYAIYDGHHRLMTSWALGDKKIKVNLVTV
jgi:hypothetical protein